MSLIDQIENFEGMPLSSLMSVLVKYYHYKIATIETETRPEVASRVWITVRLETGESCGYLISGQSIEIVKRRVIEHLDNIGLRKH